MRGESCRHCRVAIDHAATFEVHNHGAVSLGTLRTLAAEVESQTRQAVADAREDGSTWREIGDLLHITRQAAQQRYGTK